MFRSNKIALFWWSEIRLMGKENENYGDLLSKYIVEKVLKNQVRWIHPKKQPWYKLNKAHYFSIGSILAQATKHSIVWGSGIVDKRNKIAKADFRAVRGPETRKYIIEQGFDCPEVYGDPAILLPDFYTPEIEKKYELGIIPHYVDFKKVSAKYQDVEGVKVIDMMTLDIEKTTDEILACKKVISSSLHGMIVPHAYGIPAMWIQFSENIYGDDIKYFDYFKSVSIEGFKLSSDFLDLLQIDQIFNDHETLPDPLKLKKLKKDLLDSCPFI